MPVPLPGLLRVIHSASAVRQSSLSRSHAGKIKGNAGFVQGETPGQHGNPGVEPIVAVRDLPP